MPMLKDYKKFKTISVAAIVISSIYLFLSVASMLLVFSYVSGTDQTMAIYSLTRTIEYGRFFQRTDALFILIWILLVLSYLSIVIALCLSVFKKISNISNGKAMIFSFITIIFGVGLFAENVAQGKFIQETVYRYFTLGLAFIVSFLILLIANVKVRRKKVSSS